MRGKYLACFILRGGLRSKYSCKVTVGDWDFLYLVDSVEDCSAVQGLASCMPRLGVEIGAISFPKVVEVV
jgi:hypothetical protein